MMQKGCDGMKEMVFDCEVVTPVFLHGADKKTIELRPPSVKGAMRFWWRAAQAENDIEELKKVEDRIFGDSKEEGKSKFSIVIKGNINSNVIARRKMLPHHTGDESCPYLPRCEGKRSPGRCGKGRNFPALKERFKFQVKFRYQGLPDDFSEEKLNALFKLFSYVGGLGKRSRRGFGCFSIISEEKDVDLDYLNTLLNIVGNGAYKKEGNSVVLGKGCGAKYPFIRQVQIGKFYTTTDDLLKTICKASSEFSDRSLGFAGRGERFASPVYVSVIKSGSGFRPVITTLNMALTKNVGKVDFGKQKGFKGAIL